MNSSTSAAPPMNGLLPPGYTCTAACLWPSKEGPHNRHSNERTPNHHCYYLHLPAWPKAGARQSSSRSRHLLLLSVGGRVVDGRSVVLRPGAAALGHARRVVADRFHAAVAPGGRHEGGGGVRHDLRLDGGEVDAVLVHDRPDAGADGLDAGHLGLRAAEAHVHGGHALAVARGAPDVQAVQVQHRWEGQDAPTQPSSVDVRRYLQAASEEAAARDVCQLLAWPWRRAGRYE